MSNTSYPNTPLIVDFSSVGAAMERPKACCDLVLIDKIRQALCHGLQGWDCEIKTVTKATQAPEARVLKVQVASSDIFRPAFAAELKWPQGFAGPMQVDALPRGPHIFERRVLNNLITIAQVAGSSTLVLPYDLTPQDRAYAQRHGFSAEAGCALELPLRTVSGDWSPQVQQALASLAIKPCGAGVMGQRPAAAVHALTN